MLFNYNLITIFDTLLWRRKASPSMSRQDLKRRAVLAVS